MFWHGESKSWRLCQTLLFSFFSVPVVAQSVPAAVPPTSLPSTLAEVTPSAAPASAAMAAESDWTDGGWPPVQDRGHNVDFVVSLADC